MIDLFNPSPEHLALRELVRDFAEREVGPQAEAHDSQEKFNLPLFRRLGDLGLLGVTVSDDYGGSGMDAVAAVIVHEELAAQDAGFCLSYLAHSMLFANNLARNGEEGQKRKYLPRACSGRADRRHGHERAGRRHRRAGHAHHRSATATLRAQRRQDVDHQRRHQRWRARRRVSGLRAARRRRAQGAVAVLVEKGTPGFSLGQKHQGQAGHARLPHGGAGVRGLPGAGGEPGGRRGHAPCCT
jgi:alkylation response protein AidB-like acyl-CoA dehydrogenase